MKKSDFTAFQNLVGARPHWIGMGRAGEVIPGFARNLILHSGPPIAYDAMAPAHQSGVTGAAIFEGLAADAFEVEAKCRSGEIVLGAANDYGSGAPGCGITSWSMAVLIVEERHSGTVAFAPPIEGGNGGGLAGWGVYHFEVARQLRDIALHYAPLLDALLREMGGVDIVELFAAGLAAGDEEHTRQVATDHALFRQLTTAFLDSGMATGDRLALLGYLASCRRFVHHIGCAAAVASLKAAAGVPGARLVTAMGGNGVEFGIKLSDCGDRWFTAPAPEFTGYYFSPAHHDGDGAAWLGDSSNVEAWGLGGMAAAAAPALLAARGQSFADGVAQSAVMAEICFGRRAEFHIPALGLDAPCGIDPAAVVRSGITPVMHGGILSRRDGGQIGIGTARAPLACFEGGLAACSVI